MAPPAPRGRPTGRPRPRPRPPSLPGSYGPSGLPAAVGTLLTLTVLLLCAEPLGAQFMCGPGLVTPGVTIPQGDIILEEGQLLELYCVLNLTHPATMGRNASNLAFYRMNRTIGPEHLQVVNETTLKLTMRPEVSAAMFYCKLSPLGDAPEEVVCLNNVAVGYRPQNVSDFSCVSQNWQNLTCSWKKRPNPIKTRYKVWYRLPGRAGGRSMYGCPEDTDVQDDKCVWNETSNPPYRLPYDTYFFTLDSSNHLSNATFHYRLNHYAHVIPAKAEKLRVKEKTSYSATIEWLVPYPMQNFPPGLVHRVEYLPQWEARESWQRVNTSLLNFKFSKHELNITSLKYANTLYDIRVYLKSTKADENDNSLWSAPAAVTVRTKPDLPGAPPRTDIGSFEVYNLVDSRDVYIYWQTIPDYLQNGDNFSYKIISVVENGVSVVKEPSEINKKYAKFSKVGLNKSLHLQIASSNTEGLSVNKSEIYIPPRYEVPPGPLSVTKVFYDDGMYELSWKPPSTGEENISSYTIFWCDSISDHMCSGYLNWTRVPSNVTIRNMTVEDDKPYKFAVSANTDTGSSGMVWASCTILYNKPIQKMKNVWVKKVGSTYMELAWHLDCFDRNGLVVGFRVYYCPVQHKGPECKSAHQNVTIHDAQQSSANLTGLRPYTTYSVAVAVLSSGGESLPSEPLLNVTLEAAPSPPLNVSIVSITNTSITITWNAPEDRNGVITKYEVHYDGKVQTKNNDNNNNNKKQELVLDNLTSYYNYSISVAACTIACSDTSPPLTAETKVGEPGIVNAPRVLFLNQSLLSVSWNAPARPSGLLDYYEVLISYPSSDNDTRQTLTTNNTTLMVHIEGCSENSHPYAFAVRAVNVDPNTGKEFKGKWSNSGVGSCYTNELPEYLKIIIYLLMIFLIVFVSCLIICASRMLWNRCKDMRDVEVKLPPGIVLQQEPDRDQDFTLHQWVNHNHDSKPPHGLGPAADEERLLQQKDENHHDRGSGDSSGCSSGHESVASSATDGTHVSSDSGTEVDRNEQGYPSNEPSWEAGAGSDWVSAGQRQASKSPAWDEAYAYVGSQGSGGSGGKGVRSTPNLTELEPGYTVMSLASWASSGSIPDKAQAAPVAQAQAAAVQGYVALDTALPLPPPVPKPPKPAPSPGHAKQGYIAHPPTSLLWDHGGRASDRDRDREAGGGAAAVPAVPKGYVQTGMASPTASPAATPAASPAHGGHHSAKEAFTPECEGSWEEPLRLQQGRGECVGVRPSRTEPSLGSLGLATGAGGYVMTGENGLPVGLRMPAAVPLPGLARRKPDPFSYPASSSSSTSAATPLAAAAPVTSPHAAKQAHEYVLTGERVPEAPRPLVDVAPPPPKAYCRVSERERERDALVRPLPFPAAVSASSSSSAGYVPHRQLEAQYGVDL